MQQSILGVLEERGFVKDVAGGRQTLDWLLTEKRIGAYVGVDPTAPSLHVGHLLPLMALYWMYFHGYYTVSLANAGQLGGGTVQIGDPSGRSTARSRMGTDVQAMNIESIQSQLENLWTNVKCLGIKHQYSQSTNRRQKILNNREWLRKLSAIDLLRDLGSGMRLGTMLNRDSVKMRMESGEGMAISEFSYPLFQAYDWWSMYKHQGVQLQIGGSDQYGNICAGMDAVSHMRKIHHLDSEEAGTGDPRAAVYGLTTPLLTTASGEKFGKSAGNAVWLDRHMLNSFDLYQYFLRTADDDVERYLKLFTFLPLQDIKLLMAEQRQHESKRAAQHVLAKEIVELAHGAAEAKKAETAHKEAFSNGTNTFALGSLRKALAVINNKDPSIVETLGEGQEELLAYKKAYAASSTAQTTSGTTAERAKNDDNNVVTLPITLLQAGSFPRVLYAAGLASSKSEAHRLIAKKGAYVVAPNSGSIENPTALKWMPIESANIADPNHFLIDWEALVLRSGKSKIQVCRILLEGQFEAEGLTCPGWEEFKAKRAEALEQGQQ
ncbi:tyrosyl-tRNA synthetase-like protein [Dothidotthia symphoricarpi CBS 119687]|uniref:Tyrosine--tRNA ligase n=1 Tax=Dothidotthia symphoricarpi CBS 119687 TaxID=1392245 RepID=A0A6A6ANZ4_9PLEO|nr:tyrosyl-tRNA synthetase-like protein [Dothidotthia symphoricarpi CBS 119687]KAF2132221.1 tyrosyl-tRNA synthetase-like protein [Dothidotthia symphoricarpi CBS 119687]